MDCLFSCRNCIHNSSQSLNIGRNGGYCLKHESVIENPDQTTCKYLHRKDLPRFVVDEGLREHAAEFAPFSGLVNLDTLRPIGRVPYSERFVWHQRHFDPTIQSLAQYRKTQPSWVFVQAMAGGLDGRRQITHAALVRRYMDRCGTWKSSYRLVLGLLQEIATEPQFTQDDLHITPGEDPNVVAADAIWDVVFTKLSGLQEYGFHAGLEDVMWASDTLNGGLSSLNWPALQPQLREKQVSWTDEIIRHAEAEGVFFPAESGTAADELAEEKV